MLDDEYIFQCPEEVIHREQDLELRAYGASSVPNDERIYILR